MLLLLLLLSLLLLLLLLLFLLLLLLLLLFGTNVLVRIEKHLQEQNFEEISVLPKNIPKRVIFVFFEKFVH